MHATKLTFSMMVALGLAMSACSSPAETSGGGGSKGKAGDSGESGNAGEGNGSTKGGAGSSVGSAGGGSLSDGACFSDGTIMTAAEYNYSVTSSVHLPVTKIKPKSELSFDWSGLTKDYFLRSFDNKADVVLAMLGLWALTPEQFAKNINDDTLGNPEVTVFLETKGELNKAGLFDLEAPAGPVAHDKMLGFFNASADAYPPDEYFYSFMVGSSGTPGKDLRMVIALQLDEDSSTTEIKLANDSMQLEYSVSFDGAKRTLVPKGKALTVDWTDMETTKSSETNRDKLNAMGHAFKARTINQIKVARLTETEEEIMQKETLLKIYENGKGMKDPVFYTLDTTEGAPVDLSQLKDDKGNAFTGIDSDHRWILALINSNSRNPAPWYFTFLKPCN